MSEVLQGVEVTVHTNYLNLSYKELDLSMNDSIEIAFGRIPFNLQLEMFHGHALILRENVDNTGRAYSAIS